VLCATDESQVRLDDWAPFCKSSPGRGRARAKAQDLGQSPAAPAVSSSRRSFLRVNEALQSLREEDDLKMRAPLGHPRRFGTPRRVVGYLGLDPRVRQSGPGPAKHGRISKQGSAPARYALVEAAWSVVRQPGPLRAFYERVRVRRGHQVAIVAAARKLACLFWCLLTREEDYAYAQPGGRRRSPPGRSPR
jgi:transposase